MSEQTLTAENTLEARFPGVVVPETRKGFEGYIVSPENLVEVATALRDEFGYDYLSSVTAVITWRKTSWKSSTTSTARPAGARWCSRRQPIVKMRVCHRSPLFIRARSFRSARPGICWGSISKATPTCAGY